MRQIKAVSRVAFRGAIAFILSLSLLISSLPFSPPAIAAPWNTRIPQSLQKPVTSTFKQLGKVVANGKSFLPDISLISGTFQGNLIPTIGKTFAPAFSNQFSLISFTATFAPTVSLINHLDFYFDGGELNFIKIVVNSDSTPKSQALKFYKKGVNKLQKDDYGNAITNFSEALKRDGNFAEAHTSRGRAYLASADSYAKKGQILEAQEHKQLALKDFNLALQVRPKQAEDPYRYVEPLLARGLAYVKLQDYESALEDFSLAIEKNPEFYEAYLSRATIALGFGDYQQALQDLNTAVDKKTDYPAAFLRRGSILAAQGNYRQALDDFDRVLSSQEKDAETYVADTYYKRGLAYVNMEKYSDAVDSFTQAINRDKTYAEAYYTRGLAHGLMGDTDKGIKDYNQAIAAADVRGIEYPDVYYQRGLTYLYQNDVEAALVDFQTTLDLNPKNEYAHYNLGNSYLNFDQYDKAINQYNQAIEISLDKDSIDPQFYQQRGVAYFFKKQSIDAIADLQKTVTLQEKTPDAYFWWGNVLANAGNYTEAVEKYSQAIILKPDFIEAYLWQGKSYYKLKQYDRGAKNFNDALALDSTYDTEITRFIQDEIFPETLMIPESSYTATSGAIAIGSDSKILATSNDDKIIELWNLETGRKVKTLPGHRDRVRSIALSLDGQFLASGSDDQEIRLWNWKTGRELANLVGHNDKVTSVEFSPDGDILASGSDDKTVKLWDWKNGIEIATLAGHDSYVQSLDFSPDGHSLISVAYNGKILVWRIP